MARHASPPTAHLLRGLLGLAAMSAVGLCGLAAPASVDAGTHPASARTSSTQPLEGVNIAGLGRNSLPAAADHEISAARAVNARVVRVEVPWSILEPRSAGQVDPGALAYLDRLASDAATDGIGIIVTVDSTPCWASAAPASLLRACVPGRKNNASRWPPARPADFAAVVRYLTERYGDRLAAIEVWNEPDHANEKYFAGPDKAQRYAAILKAAYPVVKQAHPNVSLIAGSLVGSNGVFLRALYAAGIKGYYDGLAVHFYTLTLASLRLTHEVQLANGDTKPLWLDEFGWSSCWPKQEIQEELPCVTATEQGPNLADVFRALAHTPYIAAIASYEMQDGGNTNFGVLSAHGARKPAFGVLARALASPFGHARPVALSLRRRGGHVVASGSGPVGDFMELEAFQGRVPRYRAVFTLDRFDRYRITLPSVLGTSGLRVRVYQYWTGPSRYAQKRI